MKRILLFFFFTLISFHSLQAQKQGAELLDSLKSRLATAADDTSKVRLLGMLSFQSFRFDTDLGIAYGEQALALAQKLGWGTGIAFSNNYIGTNYAVKGNYPKALEYFTRSLEKYTELGDKQGIAYLSNNLGNFFRIQKEYPKAIDFCMKAVAINRELNNPADLVKNYNNLGFIYSSMSDFARSNDNYFEALKLAHRIANRELVAQIQINIAENKTAQKEYSSALELAMSSLAISTELGITYDRAVYTEYVGEIYLRAAADMVKAGAGTASDLADKRKNLLQAKKYLLEAMSLLEKINDLSLISQTALSLSETLEYLGDMKGALAYYKLYAADKDSAFSKDNSITIANMEKKREIDLRDKQIIIQKLELEKKNSQIAYQIVLFVLLLLFTSIVPYFYYKRQKMEKELKAEQEKQKADRALRESEERFRTLYEESPVGMFRTTPEGKILLANRTLRTMLGYESFEELASHNAEEIGFESSGLRAKFKHEVESRGEVKDLEWKWIRRDGNTIVVREHAKAIRDAEGRTLYYDGTVEDITLHKHLERQLLQAQKLEGVGTLAGGIAHDFNNLLAMILASAELLRQQAENRPDIMRYADRIIEVSERGTSISRQLLVFSRPDQAELKPISLSHTINELKDMLKHFLPKSIAIKTKINVTNGIIMGDAGQIHQALLNLAINAGDAMTNAGTLTICEFSVDSAFIKKKFGREDERPYVGLSVQDTGKGMEKELIAKIFDPFFSTKERGKGTGLGLAMVHGIVKNHNGLIDVESRPGSGTTFTMYFPCVLRAEEEEPEADAVNEPAPDATILLVDDEVSLREMLSEYLEDAGYSVLTASNGAKALELFRRHRQTIDLVITDLGMPEMGGRELFARLTEIDPQVKVIVSSGYLDGSTRSELLGLGIRDVLTKPFKMQNIRSAILAVLSSGRPA